MERHFPKELAMASRTGPNGKLFSALFRHQVLLSRRLQGLCVGATTDPRAFHATAGIHDSTMSARDDRKDINFKAIPLPKSHQYTRNLCLNQTIRSPLY